MNTVISKLLVYIYSGYNKDVYYEMSVYILSHLSIIEFMTVSEFAQNCHTSLATIKKFCQILASPQKAYIKLFLLILYALNALNITKKVFFLFLC